MTRGKCSTIAPLLSEYSAIPLLSSNTRTLRYSNALKFKRSKTRTLQYSNALILEQHCYSNALIFERSAARMFRHSIALGLQRLTIPTFRHPHSLSFELPIIPMLCYSSALFTDCSSRDPRGEKRNRPRATECKCPGTQAATTRGNPGDTCRRG